MATRRLVIHPRRALLATAFVSILLASSPIFAVLYWLTSDERGVWIPVLVVHLALFLSGIGLFIRQLMVFTTLTDDELCGNGIFSPVVRVRLDDIAEVVVVDTHIGLQPEPITQYLVRDRAGRRLYRLRGNYWHVADLDALVDALPVEATRVAAPVKLREFFRAYPGSAYWFEGRPWIQVLGVLGLIAVVTGVLLWTMALVGIPPLR